MVTFNLNSRGFTLLEMMVAMVILMVGMLGMLATIDISMQQTSQNQLRDLAVGVGEEQMRVMLVAPFGTAFSNTTTVSRGYRNARVPFPVTRSVSALGAGSTEMTVTVNWQHRGVNQQHQVRTVKSL